MSVLLGNWAQVSEALPNLPTCFVTLLVTKSQASVAQVQGTIAEYWAFFDMIYDDICI